MSYRHGCIACALLIALAAECEADIFRWDNGQPIPGTEGVTLGPGVQLNNRELEFAELSEQNLAGASFGLSNLSSADLSHSTLTNANLAGAKLTGSAFWFTNLLNANLTGAFVNGTDFSTSSFTKEQLYSTASYQANDLRGIRLGAAWSPYGVPGNDLTGWDFSGQNLTGAYFHGAVLTNAELTNAIINGADFGAATHHGFVKEQLYSTASYREKDLQGMTLWFNDFTGWDFRGQNLTYANLQETKLLNANFTGAVVAGANLELTTGLGFTKEQLYSTSSYQAKDLRDIDFQSNNFTGWDFRGQNLANVFLNRTNLLNADLTGADTRGAQYLTISGAVSRNFMSRNAILPDGKIAGLELTRGERLLVRDDDGLPDPRAQWWLTPRPPIPLTIEDRATIAEYSILQLLFDADAWDSLISFQPGIPVELGGALELAFADDVNVATQVGRTMRIFDWTGVSQSGQFKIQSSYVWDTTNLYTTGEVTLLATSVPLAGDYNQNGVVDAADYVVWRKGLGIIYTQADYDGWRAHFGQTADSGATQTSAKPLLAVSEPTCVILSGFVLSALIAIRWRRIRP